MRRITILSLLLCLVFCGDKKIPSTVRAKVVTWGTSEIEYKIVTFKYLTDPQHVDGVIARVLGGSVIDADLSNTDVISGDPDRIFAKKGSKVHIDFFVEDGVIFAQNFESLAMLSLYYDYEQIVDFLITQYNFTLQEIGKFNIHYSPSFTAKSDGFKITQTERLNAAYFGGLGDFLLFKTSRLEDIPIKMNPAVLAHEFGHKVFDIRFAKKDRQFFETSSRKANWQLSGINEGFSDFISWLFVQKTDLFTKSLNVRSFQDRIIPVNWTSSKLAKDPGICKGNFYCKGSILTSALYELSIDATMSPQKVGAATIKALTSFSQDWADHRNENEFDYYYFLNRIVKEFSTEDQTLACSIFKKWFDDETNSSGLKQACP